MVAFSHAPDQGLTCNLGMCPDQESNPHPFSYGTALQPTEPHWPGPGCQCFKFVSLPYHIVGTSRKIFNIVLVDILVFLFKWKYLYCFTMKCDIGCCYYIDNQIKKSLPLFYYCYLERIFYFFKCILASIYKITY